RLLVAHRGGRGDPTGYRITAASHQVMLRSLLASAVGDVAVRVVGERRRLLRQLEEERGVAADALDSFPGPRQLHLYRPQSLSVGGDADAARAHLGDRDGHVRSA